MDENQNMDSRLTGISSITTDSRPMAISSITMDSRLTGISSIMEDSRPMAIRSTARITGHHRSSMVRFQIFSAICY